MGSVADPARRGAQRDDRARDCARAEVRARVAFDDDDSAPQTVSGSLSGVAAHDDAPARHAGDLASQWGAQEVAAIAIDINMAAGHSARQIRTCVSGDRYRSAERAAPQLSAHVTFDMDRKARQQFRAKQIEAFRTALEMQARGVAETHLEQIADLGADFRRADVDGLYFFLGPADQTVRRYF